MIQINEYRLGNYIRVDRMIRQICLINNDTRFEGGPYVGFSGSEEHPYECCRSSRVAALPLDGGMLESFGFRKVAGLWRTPLMNYSWLAGLDHQFVAVDESSRPFGSGMRHVHQLQNLFFVFEGVELSLNRALA